MRISYQGAVGCYSYMACEACFEGGYFRGCHSYADALQMVSDGEADVALIPVENSSAGRVMEVYNLMPDLGLYIIGEYFLPIHLCLLMPTKAVKGLPPHNIAEQDLVNWKQTAPTAAEIERAMARIEEVRSLPHGVPQCERFLRTNLGRAKIRAAWDTAGAARDLAQEEIDGVAVVGPSMATRYGMTILRENIEDDANNTTRFLFIAKKPLDDKAIKGQAITSLIFETPHQAGSLVKALRVFEKYNINMTKLETYMTGEHHSKPVFHVDAAVNQYSEEGAKALQELKGVTRGVKLLGTYPASLSRQKAEGFAAVS